MSNWETYRLMSIITVYAKAICYGSLLFLWILGIILKLMGVKLDDDDAS